MLSQAAFLVAALVFTAGAAGPDTISDLWGEDRACLKGDFTRSGDLEACATPIEALDQDAPFFVTCRFQTVDGGSYAGLAFVGVRDADSDFTHNGAGAIVHRHNDKFGLVAYAFICDSEGTLHQNREEMISLSYGRAYDLTSVYAPDKRTVTVTARDVLTGEQCGEPSTAILPEGKTWSANRLACWNYADGHNEGSRLSLYLDAIQLNKTPPLTFANESTGFAETNTKRFTRHDFPDPPPLSELLIPRDMAATNVPLTVDVLPHLTGSVRFDLMTYAGDVLWSQEAAISAGKASAILKAEAIADVPKGEYVVSATLGDQRLCAALCLRGRVFRDMNAAPAAMQAGDEIIISDLSGMQPAEAFSATSEKGKWWRRNYTLESAAGAKQSLVCVEERDMVDPESCLAPPIHLPLDLEGWYEIWVRTYRADVNGGVDVRLSGEKYFVHMDPRQVSTIEGEPSAPVGSLVELRYRAADLTGQDLIFQQPFGTWESEHALANAALAGVRLVKLSDAQVARIQTERARKDVKNTSYDNDGFSYFWRWGTHDPTCIARLLEPLRDQSADFLHISLGGLGGIIAPTPYTGMYQMTGHTRRGDYRANDFFRWCFEEDVNVIDVLAERAHEIDLRLFVALMMQRCYSPDKFVKEHPEWKVKRGPGTWDYALPEVHDFQIKKMAWIIENHDIDGFTVDYTRYGHYFNKDEPDKFGHMNTFLRKLRAATDAVNAKKERKVLLCASFADRSRFIRHWGSGKLSEQGLDIQTWLDEELFDIIMPEGPTALDFVEMAKGTKTQVLPRKAAGYPYACDKRLGGNMSPSQITQGFKEYADGGAPGIFFFNHDTWTTFGRLGFKEELALRAETSTAYGMREMGPVVFSEWYPSIEERNAQREALKPATVECDRTRKVVRDLVIPLPNTFKHPVSTEVTWAASKDLPEPLTVTPATQSVDLAPSAHGQVSMKVSGSAPADVDALAANIVLRSGDQTVMRHRLPVRAVPYMRCAKIGTGPSVGAIGPEILFPIGESENRKDRVAVAMAYNKEYLYVLLACSGLDISATPRAPQKRDDRAIRSTDHMEVLIDTDGSEQRYFQLYATPAEGQLDARWQYKPFMGYHVADHGWKGDWTTETTWRDDGYETVLTIPFKALGRTPESGTHWRINIVTRTSSGESSSLISAWSSPDKAHQSPEGFGVVLFE